MSEKLRGIIFDLDNTLFDFIAMKEKAVDAAAWAMIDAGLNLTHDEIQRRIFGVYQIEGIEFQKVFDEMLRDELGEIDNRILAAGVQAYRKVREAMLVPYPHVRSTLTELTRKGLKLGVVSDAPSLQAWLRLYYLQLADMFDVVVTFEDTGQWKPAPAPFQLALKLMELKPEQTMMLGDWVDRDLAGAKRIGMRTVHARYGSELPSTGLDSTTDAAIDDFRDLLQIVEQWR
ncbi:HAD-IA family hydrolase [bacterium]|nr:HAD-IA family hydrolase [bacterium]